MNTDQHKINIDYKSYDETLKTITLDLKEITAIYMELKFGITLAQKYKMT